MLIVLGIIGIVAALTMPTLIAKHKEKETVTKLKKVYSVLDNAYMLARNEHTDVTNWFENNFTNINSKIFFDNIKPYLNIAKDCGFEPGCLTSGAVKTLDRRSYANYDDNLSEYRFALADGTQVIIMLNSSTCTAANGCGNIKVDIDGLRGQMDTVYPFIDYCNISKTTAANGRSCVAWVIQNENMDYLHCNDLSWNGKTKCK